MRTTNHLLGADSPRPLPSPAPTPTTAAADLAAVVVPLRGLDRGIDSTAALCQANDNESGLAAAGGTTGGGTFPDDAFAGVLVFVLACIGLATVGRWLARWLTSRSEPVPPLAPPSAAVLPAGLHQAVEIIANSVVAGRSGGAAVRFERLTPDGIGSFAVCVFAGPVFERAIAPLMAQFPGGKLS